MPPSRFNQVSPYRNLLAISKVKPNLLFPQFDPAKLTIFYHVLISLLQSRKTLLSRKYQSLPLDLTPPT